MILNTQQFISTWLTIRFLISCILVIQVLLIILAYQIIIQPLKIQSIEKIQEENLELRQLISDLISNKIDKQSLLTKLETYRIPNGYSNKIDHDYMGFKPKNNSTTPLKHVPRIPIEPSLEYETVRRRIRFNVLEIGNFLRGKLSQLKERVKDELPELVNDIEEIQLLGEDHKRSLIADIDKLQQLDGYEEWRQKELRDLSDLMERRLNLLQNPKDCKAAQKYACLIDLTCGFACNNHHIVNCLIQSYAKNRTMVMVNSKKWILNTDGWEAVFKPVSNTCLTNEPDEDIYYNAYTNSQFVGTPTGVAYGPLLFQPKAIPTDLALRLKRLDNEPSALWVSYFLKYIMRLQPQIQKLLKDGLQSKDWKRPIVGVHVRRTDKRSEAQFHLIEEYMWHVEDYFLTLEINGTKQERRIYLATDEPKVLTDARKKYPNYEILCNPVAAQLAKPEKRNTSGSLYGALLDIHLLSMCDFVVCTFSSGFCRTVYEIMRTISSDVAHRFQSLDDIYFCKGQEATKGRVIIAHKARGTDEIDLEIGDELYVYGNHWNGYSKGTNLRTNVTGMYPTFKVVEVHREFEFPANSTL